MGNTLYLVYVDTYDEDERESDSVLLGIFDTKKKAETALPILAEDYKCLNAFCIYDGSTEERLHLTFSVRTEQLNKVVYPTEIERSNLRRAQGSF